MKLKPFYIKVLIALVTIFIAANQVFWIYNMYNLHKREFSELVNQSADKAIFMEIAERTEIIGGCVLYSSNLSKPSDTARYISKKVKTADSTYFFTVDKNDPNSMNRITQFVLKKDLPVNLNVLDSLFYKELSKKYKIKNTWFDYIDLKTHKLIKSNKPEQFSLNYLATDTIPLDIINTVGVIGYVEIPDVAILRKMMYQLTLSVLLILIGIAGMVYIGRSFVTQWRLEKLRQQSVNAMTHEFKRPISSAVAMISLVPFYIERQDWTKVSNYANNTLTELNKLTAYTERIQRISNNEKGYIILNKESIGIIAFFEALKDRYESKGKESKNVTIYIDINTSLSYFNADLLHFSNVMDNLIENAIKYSNEAVEIGVSVSDSSQGLKIVVKDNGLGISALDIKFIFDRFYRSNRKELKNKVGFGLGLTYVKSIIDAHESEISVRSKLSEGSEFTIILKV
ncbi:MAG: HAMP domain-containing sensor histidine kinase [Paludibacter sp.]|nr:HAMP domain-containing sensor histidine kinase [Paludibacter sp.]